MTLPPEVTYTPDKISTVSTVPIRTGKPFFFRPCVRTVFTDLQAGDVIDVSGTAQVSSEFSHQVMVGKFLKVSETNSAFPDDGTILSRPAAMNMDIQMHHLPRFCSGAWEVTQASSTGYYFVQIVLYAASSAASPGDYLTLDYGEMTTRIFRA